MNKLELITAIAEQTELKKKDVKAVLDSMEDVIVDAVAAGMRVELPGFIRFENRHRAARRVYNPRTQETQPTGPTNVPKITPMLGFKRTVAASANDS